MTKEIIIELRILNCGYTSNDVDNRKALYDSLSKDFQN